MKRCLLPMHIRAQLSETLFKLHHEAARQTAHKPFSGYRIVGRFGRHFVPNT
jgi:hypothetical protein